KNYIELLATSLYDKGFQKGDRLALMLPNSFEYITTFFAVQLLGGIIVQVNPMYQIREVDYILKDSEATWFVGMMKEKDKLDKIKNLQNMTKIYTDSDTENSFYALLQNKEKKLPETNINVHEDVAILQYTGGTTGYPKGAMLTHYNIVSNIN